MVDIVVLDKIIRQTAAMEAEPCGVAYDRALSPAMTEVLRHWLESPEALARVRPLILVRYRLAIRIGSSWFTRLTSMRRRKIDYFN
jgi:hypothetical protein